MLHYILWTIKFCKFVVCVYGAGCTKMVLHMIFGSNIGTMVDYYYLSSH
jgi:hypothetical protein